MSHWKIILEDLAQHDLQEAYQWYETGKSGLGEEFLDSFEDPLSRIKRNPLHASSVDDISQNASLKRFPYEVIYTINDVTSVINVVAIIHQHRKPGWFKDRNDPLPVPQ